MIQISQNIVLAIYNNGTIDVIDGQDTNTLRIA